MKFVIFSGYNNGLGDLSFGKKIAELTRAKYPDAEIELVTSRSDKRTMIATGNAGVKQFNLQNNLKFIPHDEYIKTIPSPPDVLILGPTLNFAAEEIVFPLVTNKNTPIILMSEYDFDSFHMEDLKAELVLAQYTDIKEMPTGLGHENKGIFLDPTALAFRKDDPQALDELFNTRFKVTGAILKGEIAASEYVNSSNITVNYSHNNAERFLKVHEQMINSSKNTDVIMMGEKEKKDRQILAQIAPRLIEKGFARVIYQEIGKEPELVAQTSNSGPNYRIIHTGTLSSDEARNLRKISGDFGGATGDQSFSEAIASSSMVIYETCSWKRNFVSAMRELADSVDPTHQLSTAIKLMSSAQTETEYSQLAGLLQEPEVQNHFKSYQAQLIAENNFNNQFEFQLEQSIAEHQKKAAPRSTMQWFKAGIDAITGFSSFSGPTVAKQPVTPVGSLSASIEASHNPNDKIAKASFDAIKERNKEQRAKAHSSEPVEETNNAQSNSSSTDFQISK